MYVKIKSNKYNNDKVKRLYAPLKLFIGYILITLLISLFGPWEYLDFNKVYVVLFIIIYLMATVISYSYFIKSNKGIRLTFGHNSRKLFFRNDGLNIAKKSIKLSILLFVIMIIIKIGEVGLPNTSDLFIIMAKAYSDKVNIGMKLNRSAWLFNYFSVVYVISVILGTYYFRIMNKSYKLFYIINILLSIIYNILFIGNQKALGDLIIYIASVAFIKFCQSGRRLGMRNLMLIIIIISGCFLLFANILVSRMRLWGVEYYSVGGRAFLNIDHWSLYLFNDYLKLGIGTFLFYLSSGYYGLSLCLELPFVWSYGYGSSFAIKELLNKLIPLTDDFIASYPIRMQINTSWSAYANWHTIFPWLASDLTFIGAVVFLCIVIAIYAISWNRILRKGNWVNVLMFCHINILLLYVPANNQLFQTRASLIVTVVILLFWVFNYNIDAIKDGDNEYEEQEKGIIS